MQTPREYLADLEFHGIKLGLEKIRALLTAAGNPHRAYPAVHIAGTNGKGSVAAFLDAMLRAAGYRVGRFTSPHIAAVNERFTLNGECIRDEELDDTISRFRSVAERMDSPPTFFEMTTAVAFRWFADRQVDAALVEVGMGGRLDSTNVVEPSAAAITNIGFDHTQYLGATLEAIAAEKAGIIKPETPLVLGEIEQGPRTVILARAAEAHCCVRECGRDFRYRIEGPPLNPIFAYRSDMWNIPPTPLSLSGHHQGTNAAVAVALAEQIAPVFPKLDDRAVGAGLASARWPCRLERVLDNPPVIMDIAHNPDGARAVAGAIDRGIVLLAVSADKDAAAMIEALAPVATRFVFTRYTGPRAMPLERLCSAAGGRPHDAFASIAEALPHAIALASHDRPLIITGSIFTCGEARTILVNQYGACPLQF